MWAHALLPFFVGLFLSLTPVTTVFILVVIETAVGEVCACACTSTPKKKPPYARTPPHARTPKTCGPKKKSLVQQSNQSAEAETLKTADVQHCSS